MYVFSNEKRCNFLANYIPDIQKEIDNYITLHFLDMSQERVFIKISWS